VEQGGSDIIFLHAAAESASAESRDVFSNQRVMTSPKCMKAYTDMEEEV